MSIQKASESESKTGRDPVKGVKTLLEDTTPMETEKKEEEISRLLKMAGGLIGTREEQLEAQKKVADMLSEPLKPLTVTDKDEEFAKSNQKIRNDLMICYGLRVSVDNVCKTRN